MAWAHTGSSQALMAGEPETESMMAGRSVGRKLKPLNSSEPPYKPLSPDSSLSGIAYSLAC